MNKNVRYPIWACLTAMAVLCIATLAVVHSHENAKAASATHCEICMALHSTSHAVQPCAIDVVVAHLITDFVPQIPQHVSSRRQIRQLPSRAPPQN
jgi:hypothetical protein